jgi:hypothetical protein
MAVFWKKDKCDDDDDDDDDGRGCFLFSLWSTTPQVERHWTCHETHDVPNL